MPPESESRKTFTVQQANAMLPLVRAIVGDLAHLAQEVAERRQRLAHLTSGRPRDTSDYYQQELAHVEAELDKDTEQLQGFVEELEQLGVEPKSAVEGLVDFPSILDGRIVYLCWKLGEPEVQYWHDLESGFRGRQPLLADVGAQDDSPEAQGDDPA